MYAIKEIGSNPHNLVERAKHVLANVIDPRMDCNINRDTSQISKVTVFYQWIDPVILIYHTKSVKTTRSQGQQNLKLKSKFTDILI